MCPSIVILRAFFGSPLRLRNGSACCRNIILLSLKFVVLQLWLARKSARCAGLLHKSTSRHAAGSTSVSSILQTVLATEFSIFRTVRMSWAPAPDFYMAATARDLGISLNRNPSYLPRHVLASLVPSGAWALRRASLRGAQRASQTTCEEHGRRKVSNAPWRKVHLYPPGHSGPTNLVTLCSFYGTESCKTKIFTVMFCGSVLALTAHFSDCLRHFLCAQSVRALQCQTALTL